MTEEDKASLIAIEVMMKLLTDQFMQTLGNDGEKFRADLLARLELDMAHEQDDLARRMQGFVTDRLRYFLGSLETSASGAS